MAHPIRDFNFYLTPSSLNFRTDVDRQYGERLVRSNNDFVALKDTFFNKSYNWTRLYDFKFDLTKSLQFDFNANNIARIDEPPGRIDQGMGKEIVSGKVSETSEETLIIRTPVMRDIMFL